MIRNLEKICILEYGLLLNTLFFNQYSCGTFCVSSMVLEYFVRSNFILTATLWSSQWYYPHLRNEEPGPERWSALCKHTEQVGMRTENYNCGH